MRKTGAIGERENGERGRQVVGRGRTSVRRRHGQYERRGVFEVTCVIFSLEVCPASETCQDHVRLRKSGGLEDTPRGPSRQDISNETVSGGWRVTRCK